MRNSEDTREPTNMIFDDCYLLQGKNQKAKEECKKNKYRKSREERLIDTKGGGC